MRLPKIKWRKPAPTPLLDTGGDPQPTPEVPPTWLEVMQPHIARFEVAAATNGKTIYNATGSKAMAYLIKTMARVIDEEVNRRAGRGKHPPKT